MIDQLKPAVIRARAILHQLRERCTNPMLAYSGGKDAIVAAHLAREFGINAAACETSFYFARQLESAKELATYLGLQVTYLDSLDGNWLRANQEVIFTDKTEVRAWSFAQRQQRSMRLFAAQHGHDGIVFGRRLKENMVKAALYKTNGYWSCHPLREWPEALVWQYFAEHSIPIPWIYSTAFGRSEGNAPFYTMRASDHGGVENCWRLAEELDPRFSRESLRL